MEVNETLIDKLADLSKLQFTEAEKLRLQTDLQRMLEFVNKLNELDTVDVEPLTHITEANQLLRKDYAVTTCSRTEALQNAGRKDGQFFKVPKVIQK